MYETKPATTMRIALVVPHIYMWDEVMKTQVYAPGDLAISLANGLVAQRHKVTLFTTGPVKTKAKVQSIDLGGIQTELKKHNQNLSDLIKDDIATFKQLFKLIEFEIITSALKLSDAFDVVHVYHSASSEIAMLARLSKSPIVFTLHDPFKMHFPNEETYKLLKDAKFTALSNQQRSLVPNLNVIATIYNGIHFTKWKLQKTPEDYFIHYGRIIKPKGTHHAIDACKRSNNVLRIAGPHYEGHGGDKYWSEKVHPHIDGKSIIYDGHISSQSKKNKLLGNAKALLFPITWDEPFGLVILEANACGTPVIAFNRGSVPEIIKDGINGFIVNDVDEMVEAMNKVDQLNRKKCREYAMKNFTIEKMVNGYEKAYKSVIRNLQSA